MNDVIKIQDIASEQEFKAAVNADIPLLVDFWAPWCGPCKAIAPALERMQHRYAGKLKILKVNIDHHPLIAANYFVRSIPALILFKQGPEVARIVGSKTDNELISFLEPHLSDSKIS